MRTRRQVPVRIALAIAGLAIAWPVYATTVSYTVDGVAAQQFPGPVTPPANAPWGTDGYPGDTVEVQTYTDSIDLVPGTVTQKVNTLLWTVDYTYAGTATDPNAWSDLSFFPDVSRNMTIGSDTHNLAQSGSLEVTWETDYLSFNAGSTTSFYVDGYRIDVALLAVPSASAGGSSGPPWVQPGRDMMARFTIALIPDFNNDGAVDGGDLAIMGACWNQLGRSFIQGDASGDGSVDGGDLAILGSYWNWTRSAPPVAGETVPEPATILLLSLGGLSLIRRK